MSKWTIMCQGNHMPAIVSVMDRALPALCAQLGQLSLGYQLGNQTEHFGHVMCMFKLS
jgi:hypothetical protein